MTNSISEALAYAAKLAFGDVDQGMIATFVDAMADRGFAMSRAFQPVDTGVDDLRAKFRNVVSHATGGHYSEPEDVDRSLNDICVEISRHRNMIWKHAQESALKGITPPLDSEAVERVAAVIAPHLSVSVGCNPDCDDQNAARDNAVRIARAALTAMKENDRG